jgi:acyl dehydratase
MTTQSTPLATPLAAPLASTTKVGDTIPGLTTEAITRTTLALYAGASGDHNPMHIDSDFARTSGESDVFAHGMLSMAYLSRALLGYAPQSAIRSFGVRFASIVRVGERVTCTGKVIELFQADGEKRAKLELTATTSSGAVALKGEAVVALAPLPARRP